MKKVISISLGSSKRDHQVRTKILGEEFIIERRGTDGDKDKAQGLFADLDGEYDAFGMGGIDLYIYSNGKQYTFSDARKLIKDVVETPVVDGSGLKNTLERFVIDYMDKELNISFNSKKVLMVSAMDRFGMAEELVDKGANLVFGDLIFALGIPLELKSLKKVDIIARIIAPIITKMPFDWLYPTGSRQEKQNEAYRKYSCYYQEADIIAGDFHFIKKYMPDDLNNKTIITNTLTEENVTDFFKRGVEMIVTTTPELNGRSFGTNVMEAVLLALSEKNELHEEEYITLLKKIDFKPRVIKNNKEAVNLGGVV
ncbi:MAG: quinate 5-dehydrogenase [Halanaerobiaceae bacterium]